MEKREICDEFTELRPERQKRPALFIRDPGEMRCHSDLMILQQEWTLSPCLQKNLPGLLMTEKAHDDWAGSPQGYGTRRADPVYSLELEWWRKGQSGKPWEQALEECFDIGAFLSLWYAKETDVVSLAPVLKIRELVLQGP
ncbi:hypothetical protein NDU88_003551 [Pleurodeles waltl]|uniref:Uncharacterized protein n=1 Tax=Pleurodeles waltl TaxID=8319 RepID=A0AAV7QA04_PLEWA|nr:hypothetical protein NDU88_003551 [Pleurodeles waltl]